MDKLSIGKTAALRLGHGCQILLCLWGARFSYVAIRNLRQYEATTKKLAKWSNEVERQLNLTRSTQATGALILLTSLITATTLVFGTQYLPTWLKAVYISPAMLILTMFARGHIKSYWATAKDKDGKDISTRIPLPNMGEYNEAELMTEKLMEVLELLEYSWLFTSFLIGIGFVL